MEPTSYVALSAQMALQKQLETVANNVANASTSGFKADRPLFQSYIDRFAGPGGSGVAYVQEGQSYIDRTSGSVENTGNPLDIALDGNGYLAVNTPQGTMYSRDGHLKIGADATLLGAGGLPLQGADGSPIQIPDGYTQLQIKADGSIKAMVNQRLIDVAQIGVFRPDNPSVVTKGGNGLLTAPQSMMQPVTPNDGGARVVQGALEGSTVKPMSEIANMTELSRAYDRLQSLLTDENDREQKMIDALSRQP
jgi:flagellar basal-body rod protein FlgF